MAAAAGGRRPSWSWSHAWSVQHVGDGVARSIGGGIKDRDLLVEVESAMIKTTSL